MTRFFFDFTDRNGTTADLEGAELVSREEAFRQATRLLSDIGADEPPTEAHDVLAVKVRDGSGYLFEVTLARDGPNPV